MASAADKGFDVMRRFSRSGLQMATSTVLQSNIVSKVRVNVHYCMIVVYSFGKDTSRLFCTVFCGAASKVHKQVQYTEANGWLQFPIFI